MPEHHDRPRADEVFVAPPQPVDRFARAKALQASLPERFKIARGTKWLEKPGLQDSMTGYPLAGAYYPMGNEIAIRPPPLGNLHTQGHELGHAAYEDLGPDYRQWWDAIHENYGKHLRDWNSGKAYKMRVALGTIHPGMKAYSNDPSHSFADMSGEYLTTPKDLQEDFPDIYDAMRIILGMDPEQVK